MQRIRRITKLVFRFLLILLTLLLLGLLMLQIPAVQNFLTGKLENYLQAKFQTEVNIESIQLKLPESLALKGLYIEDLKQDTFLNVGDLTVNFKLNKLFSKQIQFDEIALSDGAATLQISKDSANYDFILSAFTQQDTLAKELDSIPQNTSDTWVMTFDDAGLELQNINFNFSDESIGLSLESKLGNLEGKVNVIDYLAQNYDVENLHLKNAWVRLVLEDTDEIKEITPPDTSIYKINSEDLSFENVFFELKMPSLEIVTQVENLEQKAGVFRMDQDSIFIQSSYFKVIESDIKYDIPLAPFLENFDYNHFDLESVNFEVADFVYDDLDITADILHASAKEKKGFDLKNLQSQFEFSKEEVSLEDLVLTTAQSEIQSSKTQVQFPFLNSQSIPIEKLKIETELQAASKNLSDIRYFYPDLDSISFFQNISDSAFTIHSNIKGSLEELFIASLEFEGLNSKLKTAGNIKNPTQIEQLELAINLFELETKGSAVTSLLPVETLPAFVDLPETIFLNGVINGKIDNFNSTIEANTFRESSPIPTQIKTKINIQNITDLDSAYLDILLDTIHTSKNDLMAYLPEDALPDYVNLPDELMLRGTITGPSNNLQSNLQLLIAQNKQTSQINAIGSIAGLFTTDNPTFNISVNADEISRQDIARFLPDSLLPAYFQLPIIKKLTGIFKGDLSNFRTNFNMEANSGNWSGNASLRKEAYQFDLNVEHLAPESFFTEAYLDSLVGFAFQPLSVYIELNGRDLDFSKNAFADLLLSIKSTKNSSMAGLLVQGKLDKQKLTAKAIAGEKEINLTSTFSLDYTKPIPVWDLDLALIHLNLEELKMTTAPSAMNGTLQAHAEGMNLDTLSGKILLSNFDIKYEDKYEQIDSLQCIVDLDNGKNSLEITSDFFDSSLKGNFQYPRILALGEQWFDSFLAADAPDSLIGKTSDHFDFDFSLHRPEILSIGLIPTLEELTPFQMHGNFDNRNATWNVNADFPYFHYQGMQFENFSLNGNAQNKSLSYQIDIQKADIQEIAQVQNFKTFGRLENQLINNTIQLLDEQEQKRFEIKSFLELLQNQGFKYSFAPKQLLNYQDWHVNKNNSITFLNEKLNISDWRFFKNAEAISILDLGNKSFKIQIEQFDLQLVSDIVKLNSNYLGGILNGNLFLSEPFTNPTYSSDIRINNLMVIGAFLGDFNSTIKKETEHDIVAKAALKGNGNEVSLDGKYDLNHKFEQFDFQLEIPSLDLQTIEPWASDYLETLVGNLHGAIRVEGSLESPTLLGKVQFENTAFDIEILKTRLRLGNQPIVFDANAIEFENLEVFDANDNKGVVSSYLLTEDYRDFYLLSNVDIKDFLVLNTTSKDNDLYYGKLLVDAKMDLTGNIFEPTIEIVAKPKKNSDLTYVYSAYSNELESHEGIVEFIIPEEKQRPGIASEQLIQVSDNLNMKIIVKIEVNENLNFKAITDPLTGDYFEGKVKGDLVYVQQPDGTMELNGNLEVVEGKYLFTYQKLIRRPFDVKPGGTISWKGDPFTPELNIDVEYKVRASTYPLVGGSDSNDGTVQNTNSLKQAFIVRLNIGGTPSKTEISTAIEYPTIDGNTNDSDIQAAISRINQDQSQQNTQAFALILFNGFIAQNLGGSEFRVVDFSGNLNNVITQQLNGLANRYIKFVELDFGLDSYENNENNAQTDFRVSIRKRFLNDRLTISLDGKTTTESGAEESTSQTYLDNVTVEYALTPDGRFKIKIYNKRDFDDFIGGTGVKVGGALVFSKEFNGIRLGKKK